MDDQKLTTTRDNKSLGQDQKRRTKSRIVITIWLNCLTIPIIWYTIPRPGPKETQCRNSWYSQTTPHMVLDFEQNSIKNYQNMTTTHDTKSLGQDQKRHTRPRDSSRASTWLPNDTNQWYAIPRPGPKETQCNTSWYRQATPNRNLVFIFKIGLYKNTVLFHQWTNTGNISLSQLSTKYANNKHEVHIYIKIQF